MTTENLPPRGAAAAEAVKALGQNPTLLAMVMLIGLMLYVFGERVASRLDHLSDQIHCLQGGMPSP